MKNYRKLILENLINKYENSTLYQGNNKQKVTISYKFNRKTIPEYFDEINYQYKGEIHEAVNNLSLHGYVNIEWQKYEEGNILKQVNLKLDKIAEIYKILNRKEKKVKENEAINVLSQYLNKDNLLAKFSVDMINKLKEGKSIGSYLDINNLSQVKDILYSIERILKQKEEISERLFSLEF